MDKDAMSEWIKVFNKYSYIQNSDEEIESNKSMIAKIKIYIPRFALIIHFLDCMFNSKDLKTNFINKESIIKSERLAQYFINQFKKIKIDSVETSALKSDISSSSNKNNKDVFLEMYKNNPDLDKTKVAELLGISRQMIYKYIKSVN